MNQTQINLVRLAAACRGDKKQFSAVCALAKKLSLPSPKRQQKQPNAQAQRLQNFVRGIQPADLHGAIAKFGTTSVFNRINSQSILETAAQKFAAMAIEQAQKASAD